MTTPTDLNRLCAEKMGWTDIGVDNIPGAGSLRGQTFPFLTGIPPNGKHRLTVPGFCGSIAEAWGLVEAMKATHTIAVEWFGNRWRVNFTPKGAPFDFKNNVEHLDERVAIVRAFLASQGVKL